MTDAPRIEFMNARSLARDHFEATDWGRMLLRELDLVIAVGTLDSMRTGRTLYDDVLKCRVADFVAPLDRELVRENLGVVDIDDVKGAAAQEIGRVLVSKPRGAMAVLRTFRQGGYDGIQPGIGFDAWMSTGDGRVDTNSGHKFLCPSPRTPETEFRRLYGTVLGRIVYEQRGRCRNEIVRASVEAAGLKPGMKVKGDHYLNGRSWTSATIEKLVENHFVGGGHAWQVRMTKPGCGKSFICEHDALMRIFGIEPVMPSQWIDPDNDQRLLSQHERRVAKAAEAWTAHAASFGFDPEKSRYPAYVSDGDALERDVFDTAHALVGSFRVEFLPGTDLVSSLEFRETPVVRKAA